MKGGKQSFDQTRVYPIIAYVALSPVYVKHIAVGILMRIKFSKCAKTWIARN